MSNKKKKIQLAFKSLLKINKVNNMFHTSIVQHKHDMRLGIFLPYGGRHYYSDSWLAWLPIYLKLYIPVSNQNKGSKGEHTEKKNHHSKNIRLHALRACLTTISSGVYIQKYLRILFFGIW